MAIVRFPPGLQQWTRGQAEVEVPGATVAELVARLEGTFPRLKDRLISRSGKIAGYVRIFVDGADVAHHEGLRTEVDPDAEVTVVIAVAGG
jgi:molybdopterin synthase sulfur carrier subunit